MRPNAAIPARYGRRLASTLLLAGLFGLFLVPSEACAETHSRPNILFLLADDQRSDTISAYGNPHISTPSMDRLVHGGFNFRRNYCFGSDGGAVCTPSRAMMNSGRHYMRVSSTLEGVKILPEILRANGYTTFGTGKWHNKSPAFLRGFEHGKAVFFGGMCDHTKVKVSDVTPKGEIVNERVAAEFSSELFANAAIDFLENHDGNEPFYAYVSFTAPHDPRQPPPKYREMYYKNRPPLPGNFLPQHPFDNGHMVLRDENLAPWPRTEEVVSDQLAEYYGLVTHLDEQIGRILAALEESGHDENTIIIYAADHGLAVGSHGLLGKQNLYEHSMGCPLIFFGPGVPRGESSQALTYLFDIFPTVLSLAAIDLPNTPSDNIDGHDLRPIWEGRADSVRDSVFLAYRKIQRAVLDSRWKLIRYPQIDHTQLFDLQTDPLELKNLAADPAYIGQRARLSVLLKEWQARVKDDTPWVVEHPKPKEIDLTGHDRKADRYQPEWILKKYF